MNDIVYFILGCAFMGIQAYIFRKMDELNKPKFGVGGILTILSNLAIMFSLAWAYESIVEYHTQAAVMGIVAFGGTGIILAIIAYRVLSKSKVDSETETQKVEETAQV